MRRQHATYEPTSLEGARYGPLEASKPLGTTRLKKKA
jgi:hypothetical protein